MEHAIFLSTVLAAALAAALLEVQIEGKAGWASSLPTWRRAYPRLRAILGNRAITGYHVYMHALVLVLAHLPYGLGLATPSWSTEARILAFVVLFWVVEDFLWFVVNPAYGLAGFRRDRAWWHADSWWGFMPRDYWIFLPVGAALYALSHHLVS
jgi:hypothetical protein